MKKSLLVLAIFCLTIANAQSKKDRSKIVTVERTTSDYDQIETSGSFTIQLVEGTEGKISIKAEQKILPFVKTEVKDGVLSVYVDDGKKMRINFNSEVEITIPVKEISKLTSSGSGTISNSDLLVFETLELVTSGSGTGNFKFATSNLQITHTGSGALTVKGKTGNLKVNSSGSGSTNLSDLTSENATVNQIGSGSTQVYCTKILLANATGSGSIQYQGNPQKIQKNATGSGSITGR